MLPHRFVVLATCITIGHLHNFLDKVHVGKVVLEGNYVLCVGQRITMSMLVY